MNAWFMGAGALTYALGGVAWTLLEYAAFHINVRDRKHLAMRWTRREKLLVAGCSAIWPIVLLVVLADTAWEEVRWRIRDWMAARG